MMILLKGSNNADVHDGADVREVSLCDPEVERAEGFARHDTCSVLQVRKPKHNFHLQPWFKKHDASGDVSASFITILNITVHQVASQN